jgi:NADH-quinone oxidoreductase subunit C
MDLTVVHHVGSILNSEKFELIYNLTSMEFNKRISISVFIRNLDIFNTIIPWYHNAEWLEREAYDMFGIHFLGNKDLRRLLTDYGFEGNPLKKDFPLSGFTEMRYSETHKRVIYEAVSLSQKSREATYISPWTA